MGTALTKLCCCGLGQRRQQGPKSPLLAPSLAPSRGSSPTRTEPFFSAHSSPERPSPALHPRVSLTPDPSALVIVSTSPLAVLIPGFLTLDECNFLISLARPHLRPSKVCGAGVCPDDRRSTSMFFTAPWATHVPEVDPFESRAAALASAAAAALGRGPLVTAEAAQIVQYTTGQFYAQHHDNHLDGGGKRLQRAATLIVYLCDVEKGGETAFPLGRAAAAAAGDVTPWGKGFGVRPRVGQALLFWSALPGRAGGGPDPAAVHAAATVKAGEKWIATRWFREEEDKMGEFDENACGLGCYGGVID